jgi:hypothetical protein
MPAEAVDPKLGAAHRRSYSRRATLPADDGPAAGQAYRQCALLRSLASVPNPPRLQFHERRTVPWWWSVVGAVIAVPTTEAVVVMGPEMSNQHPTWALAIGCLVVTLALEAAFLVLLGRSTVDVDESGLRAGKVALSASHIGRARPLDAATAHRLLGPGLRADAQLSLRPWIKTAVQIEVDDMVDTTPYWVVATRRPSELVAALEFVRYAKAEL